MKKIIYILLSFVVGAHSAHGSMNRTFSSIEENDSLVINVENSKEEKIKKLFAIKEESTKMRIEIERQRQKVKNDKIGGAVGIGITTGFAALFFLAIKKDWLAVGLGTLFYALPASILGTSAVGYKLYVDSNKLDELEKQLLVLEAQIDKQIEELNEK